MVKEKAVIIVIIFLFWVLATAIAFALIWKIFGKVKTMEALVVGKTQKGKKYIVQILIDGEQKEVKTDKKRYETIKNGKQMLIMRKNKIIGIQGEREQREGK